jgi:succinate-semialdehyde dehydrogenase/glutarate-semialdehyde dehydrogenase
MNKSENKLLNLGNLIGKEWVTTDNVITVYNPATGDIVGTVPSATEAMVEESLMAAEQAFQTWSSFTVQKRARFLHDAAQKVRSRQEQLAILLTLEQGKPLRDARKEIAESAYVLDYFAEEAVRIYGEVIPLDSKDTRSIVIRQPIGPVVAITPWNYPVSLLAWKVAPALAAGCTVVAKPASETPLAATEYIRCLVDAGIPEGVVNVVTGKGAVVGNALISNPIARKIAFTGSTEVGKDVMKYAAENITKVSLELGGHSPFIVMSDANLEQAAFDGAMRSFRAMGQNCNAVNRIFVHESIYEPFVNRLVHHGSTLTMGDGFKNPDIDLGPMLNEAGIRRMEEQIVDALKKGGQLLLGGKRPETGQYKDGYFFEPTVIANAGSDAKILQEESFGPLVHVQSFSTTEEAIKLGNNTKYGLVSYLYTNDLTQAFKISEAIESGTVCVNNTAGSTIEAPYGGWKQSGIGVELSHHGLQGYLQLKHIRLQLREM